MNVRRLNRDVFRKNGYQKMGITFYDYGIKYISALPEVFLSEEKHYFRSQLTERKSGKLTFRYSLFSTFWLYFYIGTMFLNCILLLSCLDIIIDFLHQFYTGFS